VDYDLIEEVLTMAGKQSTYQKNRERTINDLLSVASPEELARALSSKAQLRGLDHEEQERLKQLLQKLLENK